MRYECNKWKIIERIVNIPANTAFESFSKFLKLKNILSENQTQQLGTLFLKRVWVGLDTYSIMATISFLAT